MVIFSMPLPATGRYDVQVDAAAGAAQIVFDDPHRPLCDAGAPSLVLKASGHLSETARSAWVWSAAQGALDALADGRFYGARVHHPAADARSTTAYWYAYWAVINWLYE